MHIMWVDWKSGFVEVSTPGEMSRGKHENIFAEECNSTECARMPVRISCRQYLYYRTNLC